MTAPTDGCPRCGDVGPTAEATRPAPHPPYVRPATAPAGGPTATELSELRAVVGGHRVRPHFQPIVDLETGATVGHEALARGPEGPLRSPDDLFRVARASGAVRDLDWECCRAGLAAADGALRPDDALFLNTEPSTLGLTAPSELVELFAAQTARRPVVVEISERSVLVNPAQLLRGIRNIRRLGAHIALDDVGASADSLALMPFVDPDIVKLDMSVVHGTATIAVARLLRAVHAQVERTGAAILAEGIEHEDHLEFARGLGATLGQGWLFGRPTPVPSASGADATAGPRGPRGAVPLVASPSEAATPFGALPAGTRTSVGGVDVLRALSDDLEDMAPHLPSAPVVLVSLQRGTPFTARMAARLRHLAEACTFTGLSADGVDDSRLPGVRVASHPQGRPGTDEWAVVVMSSHFSGAVLARALDPDDRSPGRRYEYAVTHDRSTVVRAGAALLRAITDA